MDYIEVLSGLAEGEAVVSSTLIKFDNKLEISNYMIKQYFKQYTQPAAGSRNCFPCIYIAGIALAIATATVFAISYYIRIAPTTLFSRAETPPAIFCPTLCCYGKVEHWQSVWGFRHNFTRDFVSKLKTPQMVSTIFFQKVHSTERKFLAGNDGVCDIKVSKASVDTTFFQDCRLRVHTRSAVQLNRIYRRHQQGRDYRSSGLAVMTAPTMSWARL